MIQTRSSLIAVMTMQGIAFLRLRGDWRAMPTSGSFLLFVMALTFIGGMAEQLARGRSLEVALGVTVAWMAIIALTSKVDGKLNTRLASALCLLSVLIQMLLVMATWIPVVEWPVALWSGVAIMHLLSSAGRTDAGVWR
jgi:hypothetical protein